MHDFLNGSRELFYQQRYYDIGDEDIPTVSKMLGASIEQLNALTLPESLSITHLLDVEVTRLSNGQLKKLLLLKSFLKGIPRLLLLDYPFEGLDIDSRKHLCSVIDFMATRHQVQIILIDQHHHLPSCINRSMTLNNFKIEKVEAFSPVSVDFDEEEEPAAVPSHMDGEEIIRIRNLQLKYGVRTLFKDFNWQVNRGQRWALVGRNGTGKTTLFSMIYADHPQAYAQEIYLFGRRRGSGESIRDIKKRINYLGPEQISYFNPKSISITGMEYLKSNTSHPDNEVLANLIDHFGAQEIVDKPVRHLSSGELQLLMIMHCFLSEKELFLLDEPFQFLDNVQKKRLKKYLLGHLKEGTTLILITHYENDIRQWTDMKMEI
jgi:molybdate transport system ATP-binding protein